MMPLVVVMGWQEKEWKKMKWAENLPKGRKQVNRKSPENSTYFATEKKLLAEAGTRWAEGIILWWELSFADVAWSKATQRQWLFPTMENFQANFCSWPQTAAAIYLFFHSNVFICNRSRETLTSGSESWDTVRGSSGWEDSGALFLQPCPWAEISICTFCVGEGNVRTICERHLTGFPSFPTQSIERSRQPGEALGAGI